MRYKNTISSVRRFFHMKNAKRILCVLLTWAMLMMALPPVVAAEAPINANDKWFGYGVNCYLLNPTIAAGDTDGLWYELTAEENGILCLEHKYKDVDYTITISVNGKNYVGGSVNGDVYNGPIMTYPVKKGDVASIRIVTAKAAAGTVYASIKTIVGDIDDPVKVKSNGIQVYIAAGKTVYFQDDSLNAIYATKGLLIDGAVADTTFYAVSKSAESASVVKKAFVDSDIDGVIEAKLGGSLGSAGAPPVKPAWAIENSSTADQCYTLTIVNAAHECVYDNDADIDCNSCGALRGDAPACPHEYSSDCDSICLICGKEAREADHKITHVKAKKATCVAKGNIEYWHCNVCNMAWLNKECTKSTSLKAVILPATNQHTYDGDADANCNVCGAVREPVQPDDNVEIISFGGNSVSEDINGLAFMFKVPIEGLVIGDGYKADYTKATIQGQAVTMMGAILSNNGSDLTLEDVDGEHVANAKALKAFQKNGVISFAVRVINIPDKKKDATIYAIPYYVSADGHVWYGDAVSASYNNVD